MRCRRGGARGGSATRDDPRLILSTSRTFQEASRSLPAGDEPRLFAVGARRRARERAAEWPACWRVRVQKKGSLAASTGASRLARRRVRVRVRRRPSRAAPAGRPTDQHRPALARRARAPRCWKQTRDSSWHSMQCSHPDLVYTTLGEGAAAGGAGIAGPAGEAEAARAASPRGCGSARSTSWCHLRPRGPAIWGPSGSLLGALL